MSAYLRAIYSVIICCKKAAGCQRAFSEKNGKGDCPLHLLVCSLKRQDRQMKANTWVRRQHQSRECMTAASLWVCRDKGQETWTPDDQAEDFIHNQHHSQCCLRILHVMPLLRLFSHLLSKCKPTRGINYFSRSQNISVKSWMTENLSFWIFPFSFLNVCSLVSSCMVNSLLSSLVFLKFLLILILFYLVTF